MFTATKDNFYEAQNFIQTKAAGVFKLHPFC